jgi:hypothetical protein
MDSEAWLVSALLVAVTLPLTWLAVRERPPFHRRTALASWLAVVAVVTVLIASYGAPAEVLAAPSDRPIELAHEGYVSSRACKACHPGEYASWHRSYHRTMTQVATADTVAGPIDGTVVQARGRPFALARRGKEVWVELDDPDHKSDEKPERVWRQIVQTTGSHNEQFYWISSGLGRNLSILPIMYRRLDEKRWASLDGCCISEPGAVQDLADGRWNRVCNRCHATHALPGIEPGRAAMDTKVAELGIACEACHGPGGKHAELHRDPLRRYARHASDEPDDSIVQPARLSKERSSEVCGQCHGIHVFHDDEQREEWRTKGFRYRPGDVLADSKVLETEGLDKFWPDGMVRVSGREYNGLVHSPCFERGEMTCLSCHSLHHDEDDARPLDQWADDQLRPGMDGDRACTQCHQQFPTPAAVAAHTHHAAGSRGSACMNCHMPYTTYGLLKGIRSHQVSSPSVRANVATGRPNACNQCHLDRTLAWAADRLHEWYAIDRPPLDEEQRTVAVGVSLSLKGDAGQRVIAAWSMGWKSAREASGTDWMTPCLTVLMQDPYAAVRYVANRSISLQSEAAGLPPGDPVAPGPEQVPRVNQILRGWAARTRSGSAAFLFDDKGGIDQAAFQKLLSQRNERPVVLNE